MAYRRKGKGKKGNFYDKRARKLAARDGGGDGGGGKYDKKRKMPNDVGNDQSYFHSRKQRFKDRLLQKQKNDREDEDFGFEKYESGGTRVGWCLNIVQTVSAHPDTNAEQSSLDLYFVCEDNSTFKASCVFHPYFYIYCAPNLQNSMEQFLLQKFESRISSIKIAKKIDLDAKNHLSGEQKQYLKLIFENENDMKSVCRELQKKIEKNKEEMKTNDIYNYNSVNQSRGNNNQSRSLSHLMNEITDIREFDVPYITRACIDLNVRIAKWFDVTPNSEKHGLATFVVRDDMQFRPDIKIFAFDIETTKPPLKFPKAEGGDKIMMISYMIDTDGYLIVNREIVSEDIEDFEYTPKAEYPGLFTIFNEDNELDLLKRFYSHIRSEKPHVYVTYNGDFFDWPFIEKRSEILGLDMKTEICVWKNKADVYLGRFVVHLDAFNWVQRDSYLPQGSQSLKAVTRYKLGYNPVELDPELMLPFARDRPHELATYSVSDAVATYYLFKKYVQAFIFSLCQIIPLTADHVLRKGSGTLCEALLMIEAYRGNIIAPNKVNDKSMHFYKGHLLDNETYIGGTVEAFESGVFRSDLKCKFVIETEAIDELISEIDECLKFAVEIENKPMKMAEITNYDEIRDEIVRQLSALKNDGDRIEVKPLIYHLDVAAMYPNIILTNRLQPVAVVDDETCAACDYNRPGKTCQRFLPWKWRGKYFPASKGEVNQMRAQIEYETFDSEKFSGEVQLTWNQKKQLNNYNKENNANNAHKKVAFNYSDLNVEQQHVILKKRVKDYSQKVYRRQTDTKEEMRESCICQKENGFYVDTVRAFRDRRYYYKGLTREWKGKLKKAQNDTDKAHAGTMAVMYDSIQLAHKCILNSFYGYVMRRGSRWYSMDMAAITTHIGGNIIRDAHKLCARIGRPLELDTDGIWTLMPGNFPQNFMFNTSNEKKKKIEVEYPGSMLNLRTHRIYTNQQHQVYNLETKRYDVNDECSIFFEVDGPYRCMVMPASTEEGRKLKKRYAVFNFDGSLAELKGFEIKRRGELQMIKIFQQEVFKTFLKGDTLAECYDAVAAVGKRWLDILDTKAKEISDDELLELITESKNMSKHIDAYGNSKSLAITCARRLASFLGQDILKSGGLACKFVISTKPIGDSVSQRAVPVAIFSAERAVMKQYLKRWLKDGSITDFDIRSIVDWQYYRRRIGSNIQKIVTIPAAMQRLPNPLPNLAHPSWLQKHIAEKNDPFQQRKITSFFTKPKPVLNVNKNAMNQSGMDIEDFSKPASSMFSSQMRNRNNKLNESTNQNNNVTIISGDPIRDSELQDSLNPDSEMQDSLMRDSELQDSQHFENNNNNNVSVIAAVEPIKVNADFDDNFDDWLSQSKNLWKQQKDTKDRYKKKKRKRQEMGPALDDNNNNNMDDSDDDYDDGGDLNDNQRKRRRMGNGVDNYFQQQQRLDELYDKTWQIIQIMTLDSPGKFALWIYINNRLRRVKLQVHRPFYINIIDQESFPNLLQRGKQVSRTLPRNRPQLHLLQLELAEDDFQSQSKQISMFLTHPDVEGVYETNVPLIFRIISTIGCCCAVSQHTSMKNTHSTLGFELNELAFRSTTQRTYLENNKFNFLRTDVQKISRDTVKYMYFYHSFSFELKQGIFVFIYQMKRESVSRYCLRIIIVNPHAKSKVESPSLTRYAQQLIEMYGIAHHDQTVNKLEFQIKEIKVKTVDKAYRECNKFLNEYKLLLNGPTIVLLHSTCALKNLYAKLTNLGETFPVITFPFTKTDNEYPPLQWYTYATKKMIENWLMLPQLLKQNQGYARYSHVPIGNIHKDVWSFTSDVFYSRLLSDNKCVWWISQSCKPDLGGLEDDCNLFDDEHSNPIISNPGAYHTYCIELEMVHLATNTVLQSEHIQSLEMGLANVGAQASDIAIVDHNAEQDERDNFVKSLHRMDDSSSCSFAFKILKKLVQNWCRDIGGTVLFREQYADRLLVDFYRWLRSPSSLLYDPLLHKMVHRLMKKVLMQLIAQFRRFGANIIYASFSRIILETGKNSIENCSAYIESCLNAIKKQPLFEWIMFFPKNKWECLLWHDHANYGGYLLQQRDDNPDISEFDPQNYDRAIESRWNIASFLPTLAEDAFETVVAGYLQDVRNEYRRLLGHDVDANEEMDSLFTQKQRSAMKEISKNQSEMDISGDDSKEKGKEEEKKDAMLPSELKLAFAEYKRRMVDSHLAGKLFEYVSKIHRNLKPESRLKPDECSEIFPYRAGSHLPLQIAALEFIKYSTLVFSLDADILEKMIKLRKNLLKMIGVGDFSAKSKFADPCMTFILPDVNCFKCKQSRDLDLCRDAFTRHSNDDDGDDNDNDDEENGGLNWNLKCPNCDTRYDQDLVESMLLFVVQRRETAYNVQDNVCVVCHKTKEDDMSEYCNCSGRYKNKESKEEYENSMKVFLNISQIYKFQFLQDTVEWILKDAI